MEITITEDANYELKKVFVPLVLVSEDKEKISICMRDSGFEMIYKGRLIEAKEGCIKVWNNKKGRREDTISYTIDELT